jgi:hydrogenase maturation protein HypF
MPTTRTRALVRVTGVVQGVGFRPFVHRLAGELGLTGHVGNDAAGVFVEVEGAEPALTTFARRIRDDAPPLAKVDEVEVTPLPPSTDAERDRGFRIVESPSGGHVTTLVPADVAICDDCRRELFDPADRRYRHPFITCTNCGPRFTIVRSLPYDRATTTMAGFPMCAACDVEYHDPTDRRFHAQPVACHDCGPTLRYEPQPATEGASSRGTEAALSAAQHCLAAGGTLAVKGIGGYHLACDATSADAVTRLRDRKQRPHKPFAVMVADVEVARSIARFSPGELAALTSPERPVVLARVRRGGGDDDPAVVGAVAPDGNPRLGVMLPSSPLHELLFASIPGSEAAVPPVLIMTSGNLSGEPICYENAVGRLGHLVDGVLTHDRPIHVPCDDSVVHEVDGEVVPIRRSRGHAPLPLRLPSPAPPTLAVGGELKNTVGVANGRQAWLSQHIGDLEALETLLAFERATHQLTSFFQVDPEVVAVDLHPGYATHRWARRQHGELLEPVQHHHAHAAALLAEHGRAPDEVALVFSFDGTGYGADGTVWGGEVLLADQAEAQRHTHLTTVPLPGADAAVANPSRMALAHLWAAGLPWDDRLAPVATLTQEERRVLAHQLQREVATVPTSSIGRLFDAVSSLLGIRQQITYEGQAAIELEWRADAWSQAGHADDEAPVYRFAIGETIDPAPVLRALTDDVIAGVDGGAIAAGFHLGVAEMITRIAEQVASSGGPRTVGLTGGVFQNSWLTTRTRQRLERIGATVLTHRQVPTNDGGLAYGQLAAVAARAARGDRRPTHR